MICMKFLGRVFHISLPCCLGLELRWKLKWRYKIEELINFALFENYFSMLKLLILFVNTNISTFFEKSMDQKMFHIPLWATKVQLLIFMSFLDKPKKFKNF